MKQMFKCLAMLGLLVGCEGKTMHESAWKGDVQHQDTSFDQDSDEGGAKVSASKSWEWR